MFLSIGMSVNVQSGVHLPTSSSLSSSSKRQDAVAGRSNSGSHHLDGVAGNNLVPVLPSIKRSSGHDAVAYDKSKLFTFRLDRQNKALLMKIL